MGIFVRLDSTAFAVEAETPDLTNRHKHMALAPQAGILAGVVTVMFVS
jgi:hypothetical protein